MQLLNGTYNHQFKKLAIISENASFISSETLN
jgi:hypothetical protein